VRTLSYLGASQSFVSTTMNQRELTDKRRRDVNLDESSTVLPNVSQVYLRIALIDVI